MLPKKLTISFNNAKTRHSTQIIRANILTFAHYIHILWSEALEIYKIYFCIILLIILNYTKRSPKIFNSKN